MVNLAWSFELRVPLRDGGETLRPGVRHSLRELKSLKSDSSYLSEAIRLAHHGDPAAFEFIYRLHCGLVYRICLRMLRDPIEAEDLTQEAFVLLSRKIHTFRGESAFSTWLYRLTTNLVLMRFRKKTPVTTCLDEIITRSDDGGPHVETGGPDLHLSGLVDRMDLEAAIERLAAGSKATFILHDVQGYTHKEIAGILGCSIGNSKAQLHRARKRLCKLLRRVPHGTALQKRKVIRDSLVHPDHSSALSVAHELTC